MREPLLALSLRELLVTVTIGAVVLVLCRSLGLEPWVGMATTIYLVVAIILLLLGRGQ